MRNESGVSLLESLLVVVVISSIVILLANIPNALGLIQKSKHTSLAREIAAKQLEDKRATSYINLAEGVEDLKSLDSRVALLLNGGGTVVVEDCDVLICTDSETNAEKIKHIKVTVNWQENNKPQQIVLDTLISEGGLNQ